MVMKYHSQGRRSAFAIRTLTLITLTVLLSLCVPGAAAKAQAPEENYEQVRCSDVAPVGDLLVGRKEGSELTAKPGDIFTVTLEVANSFPYELRNIDISAALYKSGSSVPQDWVTVASDLKLASGAETETKLEWNVPRNLPAGDYEMKVYAVQGSDASPAVDVVGRSLPEETFPLNITGDVVPSGYFDLDSVTVSGKPVKLGSTYRFAADAENLDVSIDLVNTFADEAFRGPLTITVYEGFYPDPTKIVESESTEGRLISGVTFTKTLSFNTHFDRYLVAGQFLAEDGSRSAFMLPLERTDFETMMWPVPVVEHLGLVETDQSALRFVGCLGHIENPFLPTGWVTPAREVDYTLSVHRLLEGGAVADGEPIKTLSGKGSLGGENDTFGFTQELGDLPDQFALRLTLKRGEEMLDMREVRYLCDDTRTCAPPPVETVPPGSALSQFIEMAKELIGDLKLFTWIILLGISLLFIFTLRPFLKRRKAAVPPQNQVQKPKDPTTNS